ncbi:MAG: dihydropteroate synthase [Candidatus Omnitrophica bacterium]|nr:dihydropteroate synthase [Candidatus Omnitrophota bacterium]MBU1923471.1 dihydropteroate synthase [Candidatus Omnitrophota bacterium]
MRIFSFSGENEVEKVMHDIGVDPYGIKIMLPKASTFLIRLSAISNIAANILKQEMLSLGGDVAVARGVLTGKTKKTGCLIIGRPNQLCSLIHKLRLQPFGLHKLADDLDKNIKKYTRNNFIMPLGRGSLNFNAKTYIMGAINLTPDSFSGDGLYSIKASDYPNLALKKAEEMLRDGADIIDLGGESSRPGARNISTKEELRRVLPIVKKLAKNINAPISIDTTKAEVAQAALESGAQIVNDISGLRNKRMVKIVARHKAAVVIMHMLSRPVNMQKKIAYKSLIEDIVSWLNNAIDSAEYSGIEPKKIIVDPGIGFGKKPEQNLEIIKRLTDFKILGKPILIGPCRKSFIGRVLKAKPQERLIGTVAVCVMAAERGANIVRVHDVKAVSQAMKMAAAIKNNAVA